MLGVFDIINLSANGLNLVTNVVHTICIKKTNDKAKEALSSANRANNLLAQMPDYDQAIENLRVQQLSQQGQLTDAQIKMAQQNQVLNNLAQQPQAPQAPQQPAQQPQQPDPAANVLADAIAKMNESISAINSRLDSLEKPAGKK